MRLNCRVVGSSQIRRSFVDMEKASIGGFIFTIWQSKEKKMNRLFVFVIGLSYLCFAPILSIAKDVNGPQPNWDAIHQVKQAWIEKMNAKLLPPKYQTVPKNMDKLAIPEKKLYLPFVQVSIDQATKYGIPLQRDFSKQSDFLTGILKLKKLETATFRDKKLFIGSYENNDSRCPVLYLQTNAKAKFLLFADEGCGEIHLFQPGLKMPVSVMEISSGCGSGWRESLYAFENGGNLKEVVDGMGGWHANIAYADLDGDGQVEILDSTDMTNEFKDLKDLLKKNIKYFEPYMAGPIICHTSILKWDGKKYSSVGEFYHFHSNGTE